MNDVTIAFNCDALLERIDHIGRQLERIAVALERDGGEKTSQPERKEVMLQSVVQSLRPEIVVDAVEPTRPHVSDEVLDAVLASSGLFSVRVMNCCQSEGIITFKDLAARREIDLLRTANFGRKSLTEVREVLGMLGMSLAGEHVNWTGRTMAMSIEEVRAEFKRRRCYSRDDSVRALLATGKSTAEVGRMYGLTASRIHQIARAG